MYSPAQSLLRLPEVLRMTGLSKTQVYRLSRAGGFPTGIRISPRCTCWSSTEIDDWIRGRIALARRIAAK